MIELTSEQLRAIAEPDSTPPRLVNPTTNETFVLLRADEYERLKDSAYDDGPWSREELHAAAWEVCRRAAEWDEMTESDDLPEKP